MTTLLAILVWINGLFVGALFMAVWLHYALHTGKVKLGPKYWETPRKWDF